MSTRVQITRRSTLAAPIAVPAAIWRAAFAAPSDTIRMGVIGVGPRGAYVLSHFLKEKDVRVVAVADCFEDRRREAKALVDRHYGDSACAAFRFHEQILERKDVDAVLIATGDRWHAVLSVLAAAAGKDIYCEKPVTLTIAEGRSMVNALRRYGTVWQCGTQRKSIPGYRFVREVVRSGRIGRLHTITMSFGDGSWRANGLPVPEPEPDPDVFDYDRWLGQAPWMPYSTLRVAMWRRNWATSAGPIADMGPHYCEFAQWVRGDEFRGPVEYEGEGEFLREEEFNNIPYFVNVRARYPDGMLIHMDSKPKGVRFDGDKGWVHLFDDGAVTSDPSSVLQGLDQPPPGDYKVMAPHIRNFLECVKSRKEPVSSAEIAHRAHTMTHCASLCLRLGCKLRWDPESELFIGNEEANNMLARRMRAPWGI